MLTWERATKGGVRVQAQCPYCGNRVKHSGQLAIDKSWHRIECQCGAVLRILFSQAFEWEKDVPIGESGRGAHVRSS